MATGYNGEDALRLARETSPDIVVLDVRMPGGNGLAVAEMLLDDCAASASAPAIIIMTGQSDELTVRRCHQMCAFYVLKGANVWSRLEPLLLELQYERVRPQAAG